MKKVEYIHDLISVIGQGDRMALVPIIEHIGILIRQWCRKNKFEISWMAYNGETGDENGFYNEIYRQLRDRLANHDVVIKTFADYKTQVMDIAEDILREQFSQFNDLLIHRSNSAWKMVTETLQLYAQIWSKNRNISLHQYSDSLHQQSLVTLYEKITSKKLIFANSCDLKSYYFRILENKCREAQREVMKSKRFTDIIPEQPEEENIHRHDDMLERIKDRIGKLEGMEKQILLAYFIEERKLTEIADEMKISAENCRVIKHRAMKRLIQVLSDQMIKTNHKATF